MHLTLRQLAVFRTLMNSATATEAAAVLHMSQPGVSKVLRQIEDDLGLRLFERIKGRLHATPEAFALCPEVERVMGAVSAMERIVDDLRDATSGRISIAALPTMANVFLPETIRTFQDVLPKVRVSVQVLSSLAIAEQVGQGHVDIGLLTDSTEIPGLQCEDLLVSECVCILPRGHPLATRDRLTLAEVAAYPLVSYFVTSPFGKRIQRAVQQAGLDYRVAVEAGASSTICALVESGAGIAIIEPYVMYRAVPPALEVRPLTPGITVRPRLLYPQYRLLSRAARSFVDTYKRVTDETAQRYAKRI